MPDCEAIRAPHGESIVPWSGHNFSTRQVGGAAEWADALKLLLSSSSGPVLVEAFTKTEQDAAILKGFYTNI